VARARRVWPLVLAAAAIVAIAVALWRLEAATSGLEIERARLGQIPVTVFRAESAGSAPVVVIAHGFAGSQQLMQPFAVTLARNGYVAVTFDFPGHGRNGAPLGGGLADDDARSRELLDALGKVVGFARDLPHGDGRLALLGHSMASDVVVRYAQAHPEVQATVAVSLFSRGVTADSPSTFWSWTVPWNPPRSRTRPTASSAWPPTSRSRRA
jgi:alpha-beta hydrolase superfamily lysophospholipase